MTTTPPPDTAVVRVSRGDLDPSRFADVQAMTAATGRCLTPIVNYLLDWFI